jgi:HPt (histidine-containing phosphotransfer) domain-containing protein
MSTTPVVSDQSLEDLRALNPDDPAFLRELIELFLQDVPQRLAELEQAIAKGDAPLLTRAAHTIKGSCSNFGAAGLAAVALQMEHQGKENSFSEAKATLPALKAEFSLVDAALRKFL